MSAGNIIPLLHLTGFLTGAGLYGLIFWLSLRHVAGVKRPESATDRLPVLTGVLGLVWNIAAVGALLTEQSGRETAVFVTATAYGALGFLPAVTIHSVVRRGRWRWIAALGYAVAAAGAILQVAAISSPDRVSSVLRYTTIAYLAITPLLAMATHGSRSNRSWWIAAFAVFAASGIHMSDAQVEHYSWGTELLGHHASLPLAFAILFYDYRFSFGDLFLKRALAFAGLLSVSGAAALVLDELLWLRAGGLPMFVVVIVIAVSAAAMWGPLNRASSLLVDRLVLRRPDYAEVRRSVATQLARLDDENTILDTSTVALATALEARDATWIVEPASSRRETDRDAVHADKSGRVAVQIQPAGEPAYRIELSDMEPGRRLLSDEYDLLASTAVSVARRIDAVRFLHERCQRDAREQEMNRLATQAELRALRAQVNPHFLFNALNTIGYLIRTSPERAWHTLLLLTDLLRSSLRTVTTFVPLSEELRLVRAYLEIEHARFEERLRVEYAIDPGLENLQVPPFLLQPLVENAIKHGISSRRTGGEIRIAASCEGSSHVVLRVEDDGVQPSEIAMHRGMREGVGLRNIRERLSVHFGGEAELSLVWNSETSRTVARVVLPMATLPEVAAK